MVSKTKVTQVVLSPEQKQDFLITLNEKHNDLVKILLTQEVRASEEFMIEYLDSLYYTTNLEGRIIAGGTISPAEFDYVWAMGQEGGK